MTPFTSADEPILQQLISAKKAEEAALAQARDDAEHDRASEQRADLEAEVAREKPVAEAELAERTAVAREAENRRFECAATLENQMSHWTSRRQQLDDVLRRTLPAPLRAELASLDERIASQCARVDIDLTARAAHDRVVRSLQDGREAVLALVGIPRAEIPKKLEAIRASIVPAVGSGPVAHESFVDRAAAGIRHYLRQRAAGELTA